MILFSHKKNSFNLSLVRYPSAIHRTAVPCSMLFNNLNFPAPINTTPKYLSLHFGVGSLPSAGRILLPHFSPFFLLAKGTYGVKPVNRCFLFLVD